MQHYRGWGGEGGEEGVGLVRFSETAVLGWVSLLKVNSFQQTRDRQVK